MEVLPAGAQGHSAVIDVAAAPNMEVPDALYNAEVEYDSRHPASPLNTNPFTIELNMDRIRRCYVISAVSNLSSSARAQWMVRVTDSKNEASTSWTQAVTLLSSFQYIRYKF